MVETGSANGSTLGVFPEKLVVRGLLAGKVLVDFALNLLILVVGLVLAQLVLTVFCIDEIVVWKDLLEVLEC